MPTAWVKNVELPWWHVHSVCQLFWPKIPAPSSKHRRQKQHRWRQLPSFLLISQAETPIEKTKTITIFYQNQNVPGTTMPSGVWIGVVHVGPEASVHLRNASQECCGPATHRMNKSQTLWCTTNNLVFGSWICSGDLIECYQDTIYPPRK